MVETKRKPRKPEQRGHNAVIAIMKRLRAFFNWCVKRGYITRTPFASCTSIGAEKYGIPYYITLEERDTIADRDFSFKKALEVQRDIFIFQCLIGCRVSDLIEMTPDNIINGAVEYMPNKTKGERPEVVRVPLNSRAKALVNKYKGVDEKGRLFPFISTQKYNQAIKDIFTLCGITRVVTILNPKTGEEERKPLNEIASSHMARYRGREHKVDMLFFHRGLRSLVAIDLKISEYQTEYVGKMNLYLSLLDKLEKQEDENPSIGIILCAEKDNVEVELALDGFTKPIGVADYKLIIPKNELKQLINDEIKSFNKEVSNRQIPEIEK